MDRMKLAGDQANEVIRDPADNSEQQVRTLKDLELVLVGGGDTIPGWP